MTPMGITGVTERMSTMMLIMLRVMQRSKMPNRGETWTISTKPSS